MRPFLPVPFFVAVLLAAHGALAQAGELSNPAGKRPATGLAPVTPPAAKAADASESSEYKQAVEDALKEYGLGHFEEARSLFERAHAIDANARTLRGLGMVEFELRHYVRATQLLEQSLASEKKPLTPEQRTAVESLLARARQFIANYELSVAPPRTDLTVELDGKPVAVGASGHLSLEAGEHVLRISGPELTARELRLDVKGGEQQTLRIELEVKSPERTNPAPGPKVAHQPSPPPVSHPYRKLGIGLTAAGGALLVAGGVLGGLALGKANDAEPNDDRTADSARTLALVSDVSLGVGLATVAAGVVLMVWKRKGAEVELGHQRIVLEHPLRVRF